ncbi:glycosyltransferase [Limnoglobus roseus]|uniref:GT1 family glycosyltransferase n=1 Tax=Limnoglobus roseus TaxID=2598579 RepID=A0A5C1AAE4_9BACT|nr:glycosyltransferase [Limnoglobus roseus]QEL15143.1 GT1 family glycosyltransferase [Limnoglobus roseus]
MRIALYCPDMTGHLNPMTTLGRELARRGHEVSVFGLPPARRFADRAGLGYVGIGHADYETHVAPGRVRLAELTGLAAMKLTGRLLADIEIVGFRELPAAFRAQGIEAVVADQVSSAGGCVAEVLGLPCALACNALALYQEAGVPPPVLPWAYRPGLLPRLRNRLGNTALRWAVAPVRREIAAYRAAHGLSPVPDANVTTATGLVQVAQQPAFFDFPRDHLPDHFHYTGPWHEPIRDGEEPFPWDQLDGRPLVYASLGTLQNRLKHVFTAILTACETLPVQVVLALGRRDAVWDGPVPANALVVGFAPQLPLLDRAAAVVTHAGLNTALESLARGLPMVCVPVTNDQPGVAERVRWLGAGEVLRPGRVTAARLRPMIEAIVNQPKYREAAMVCRKQLELSPGVRGAADLVEEAFQTKRRVRRADWEGRLPVA